jgi:HSP20 family protein
VNKVIMAIEPLGKTDRSAEKTGGTTGKQTMPMDAYRHGNRLVVHVDLPGIKSDSVELTVQHNVLTVKAHRRRQQVEDAEWLVSERLHGSFSCQLFLSDGLDLDKIEASYDQGVLTISVPVAEQTKTRRIEVTAPQATGSESAAV